MKTVVALLRILCSSSSPPPVKRKKGTSGGWLPWWCVFLGWFLLLSLSAVSTYFTLLYGFQYGREKSIKWVMSLGLSLFQSIFILQPLKVIPGHLGQAVFIKWPKNFPRESKWFGDDVNFCLFALPLHSGDRDCCGFCPAAETCGCGGE